MKGLNYYITKGSPAPQETEDATLLLLLSAKRKSRKLVAERGSKVVEVQNKKVTQLCYCC